MKEVTRIESEIPTREKIIDAATELFSKSGFHGVSIRDITKQVGIKESSLYNHFKSKDELLDSIFDIIEEEMRSRFVTDDVLYAWIDSVTAEEFFRQSFGKFVEFWNQPKHVKMWFVVSMEQYRNKRAGEIILNETERILNLNKKAFTRMIKTGKIKNNNPASLADTYAYTLRAMHLEYGIRKLYDYPISDLLNRMYGFIGFFIEKVKI